MIEQVCPVCGGDLLQLVFTTYPPTVGYRCPKCGWAFEEPRDEIFKVPFSAPSEKNEQDSAEWVYSEMMGFSKCSNCGCPEPAERYYPRNYCPYCGKKMKYLGGSYEN